MKLQDMKIGSRLGLSFALMLILIAGIAAIALFASKQTKESLHETIDRTKVKSNLTGKLRQSLFRQSIIVNNNVGMFRDIEDVHKDVAVLIQEQKAYQDNESKLHTLGLSSEESLIIAKMKDYEQEIALILTETLKFLSMANVSQATGSLAKAAPLQGQWLLTIDRLVEWQTQQIGRSLDQFEKASDRASLLMGSISAVAMLLAAVVAWFLTRSITTPLLQAVRLTESVASGDLTATITVTRKDETGELLQALQDMNNSLVQTVTQVRTGTEAIDHASREIAAGNADLSARTESQASSLEETAALMEHLTSTVRQNTDNARKANQLAASASDYAVEGGGIVTRVIDTMASIKVSSTKIFDIIGVIDSIAFQTNILALNAAVEAARAGDNGRGFAVVAAEVRDLAQRSASAAKEIKQLISDSVVKIEAGNTLVGHAGKSMGEIVSSIKRVAEIMNDIAAASVDQSLGIEEVGNSVTQMDKMTQQNAALFEEAAAAADSMKLQAASLMTAVSTFKLPATCGSALSLTTTELKPSLSLAPSRVQH